MKPSTVRSAAIAFAVLAATLAATPGVAEFDVNDRLALDRLSDKLAAATGSGNLKPAFTSLMLARKNANGVYATPAVQAVIQYDERHSVARTVSYDAQTAALTATRGVAQLDANSADHADYALYFDGWTGVLSWTGSDKFLSVRGSKFTLDDGAKKLSLYVADVADSYPGFEWLEGPFSIIRQSGHSEVYAVWSSRLNWLVYSPDWQVEGATLDGKAVGLDGDGLIKAIRNKDWTARLAQEDEARKAFSLARADTGAKQVYRGTPVDILPAYKGSSSGPRDRAIDDPEAKIAGSLAGLIPSGSVAVSAVDVRVASPAWWTVSKGNRKVYILGVPWLFKDGVDWNQFRLSNRLRDLRGQIVLPPLLANDGPSDDGVADIVPNADKIPDDYVAHIQKAAAVIGQPAGRYLGLTPMLAGYRLVTDFRLRFGLQPELATAQVSQAALHMNFNPRTVGMVHWPDSGRSSIPAPEAGLACLDAALKEVDSGPAAFNQAIEAWAKGDVRTALTAPRGLEQCSFAFPVESQIRRDGIKLQVDAIKSALRPGVGGIVVVAYLRALLSEDGVLAQLQQQGYTIAAPIND
jgi:hypothetical protein